jgi:hypothetical protein
MSKKLSQGNEVLPMSKQLELESIEKGEFVFYNSNEVTNLEVMVKNDTVWLTQEQIAVLFGVKRPAITKHIRNIFETLELEEDSVCSILERTASENKLSNIKNRPLIEYLSSYFKCFDALVEVLAEVFAVDPWFDAVVVACV